MMAEVELREALRTLRGLLAGIAEHPKGDDLDRQGAAIGVKLIDATLSQEPDEQERGLAHALEVLAAEVEGVGAEKAMREAAAAKATSFLVGDPENGVPLRSPMPHEIADAIRKLPLTLGCDLLRANPDE